MLSLPESWVWDFWTAERDNGSGREYHVFFLYASKALHDPDRRHLRAGIGHAVSCDLVQWTRRNDVVVHGEPGEFDETATWTGSVVRHDDGTWWLFYTGTTRMPDGSLRQQVGAATSPDLDVWHKHPANPLVVADDRWYETLGGPAPWSDEHWRDPFVFADPDGDGWHMLITARANTGAPGERGVLAHAVSADLHTWQVLPPATAPDNGFGQLEVPQIARVDGRDVLLFNCLAGELASDRGPVGGVWSVPVGSATGPYDVGPATLLTDEQLYVGKILPDPAGRSVLLAFHNTATDGSFGGTISDPLPVRWVQDGGRARLVADPPAGLSWAWSAG